MNNSSKQVRGLVFSALIAAIYTVLTMSLSFMGFGAVQYRVSEGLTILPFFTPYAIPGLVIGCLLSNIISPVGILDLIFGTLATLIASMITYYIGKSNIKSKKFLAPMPPVLVNAIIIGLLLKYVAFPNVPLFILMAQVGWGELICCYGIGLPLMTIFEKNTVLKNFIS
ncbi:QueT transporter family protein [Haloimpatiens sp. FM7330]|uniref:QueT transporter family protein n=1 Tax=Haloimpatiens sp. FM7330 TaxID=3298610 RepID=UPI00364074D5